MAEANCDILKTKLKCNNDKNVVYIDRKCLNMSKSEISTSKILHDKVDHLIAIESKHLFLLIQIIHSKPN